MSNWQQTKEKYYNSGALVMTEEGFIDFSADNIHNIKNGNFSSYDEYLDAQYKSQKKLRKWLEVCYYDAETAFFRGKICRIDKEKKRILFFRIYVSGIYYDGMGFDGKEDHVWLDIKGFERFRVGDNVEFCGEVYRYRKQSGEKLINYGIKNPSLIKKINEYKLPTKEELTGQALQELKCEVCLYKEQCYGICLC